MHPASGGFWTAQVVEFFLGQLAESGLSQLTGLSSASVTFAQSEAQSLFGVKTDKVS
jgi:hypothetical protein